MCKTSKEELHKLMAGGKNKFQSILLLPCQRGKKPKWTETPCYTHGGIISPLRSNDTNRLKMMGQFCLMQIQNHTKRKSEHLNC